MANPFLESQTGDNPFLEQNLPNPNGAAVVQAGQYTADGLATAQRQSKDLGVPVDVLARNPEQAAKMELRRKLDGVRERNPALADWLAEPKRLALARDDLDGLEKLAGSLNQGYDAQTLWGASVHSLFGPLMGFDAARGIADTLAEYGDLAVGGARSGWIRGRANTLLAMPSGPAVMDPSTGRMTADRTGERGALLASEERRAQSVDVSTPGAKRGFEAFDRANKSGSISGAVSEILGGAGCQNLASSLGLRAKRFMLSATLNRPIWSAYFMGPPRQIGKPYPVRYTMSMSLALLAMPSSTMRAPSLTSEYTRRSTIS